KPLGGRRGAAALVVVDHRLSRPPEIDTVDAPAPPNPLPPLTRRAVRAPAPRIPQQALGKAPARGCQSCRAAALAQTLERVLQRGVSQSTALERLWVGLDVIRAQQALHEPLHG